MAQLEGRELEGHEVLEKGDVFWRLDEPPDCVYVVDVDAGRTVDSMNAQFQQYAVPTTAIFRRPTNKQEIQ